MDVICSSKQFRVWTTAWQFPHVCFIRIQMSAFKVYQVNPAVHRSSIWENIHSPITINHKVIQTK